MENICYLKYLDGMGRKGEREKGKGRNQGRREIRDLGEYIWEKG